MRRTVLILLTALGLSAHYAHAEVVVIVNPEAKFASMDEKAVQDIYLGLTKTLPDKVKAVPVVLSIEKTHDEFLKTYIKRTSAQFDNLWKKAVFSGKGKPPQEFETEADLIAFVKETPGAIGYITLSDQMPEVKIITIENQKKGDK
ncbi:MAG: hypothetical protein JXR23_08375 [Pontiellaceae bacterium]|nr:hypothetical protein [Pontiellaceae bacterium]